MEKTGMDLAPLARRLREGEIPVEELLDALEERFAAREERVRAFVPEPGRFERLRREARALAARFSDPAARPPLFGVPVAIKDIFHVEGFVTRAGSRVPAACFAGGEAPCVARLKQAGCLVLGKAATTEIAYFAPGPTTNPHDPARTPGGSSSGSAAAVAAGLAPLALGTQTVGSVIRPASFCGVVGFKPSHEHIDTRGIVPFSPTADTVGVFTRDVAGSRLAAEAMGGVFAPSGRAPGRRVGIPVGPYLERAEPGTVAALREGLRRVEALGWEVVDVPVFADFDALAARHNRLVEAEAAREHGWLGEHGHLCHPRTREMLLRGTATSDAELPALRASCAALRGALHGLMDAHGLDLFAAPAACGAAPASLDSTGDPVMNLPWTHAGMPAFSLPLARCADGMPLGIQCIARHGDDAALCDACGAFCGEVML